MSARRRITPALVRRLALALPETIESSHLSRPDFRVRNKIFATLPPDGQTVVLRLAPADVDALVSAAQPRSNTNESTYPPLQPDASRQRRAPAGTTLGGYVTPMFFTRYEK